MFMFDWDKDCGRDVSATLEPFPRSHRSGWPAHLLLTYLAVLPRQRVIGALIVLLTRRWVRMDCAGWGVLGLYVLRSQDL